MPTQNETNACLSRCTCPCSPEELATKAYSPADISSSSSSSNGDSGADDADVPHQLWLEEFRAVSATQQMRPGSAAIAPASPPRLRPQSPARLRPQTAHNPARAAHSLHISSLAHVVQGGEEPAGGGAAAALKLQRPHTAHSISPEARRERTLGYKAPKPHVPERVSTVRGVGHFRT